MKKDIHGSAILDFYKKQLTDPLILHNSYGKPEEMPVEVFFRDQLDFTTLEHLALIESEGKILDIGAGAGAHSLVLQDWGKEVVALDDSPKCVKVMEMSGIDHVVCEDYRKHSGKYDTLLSLMNGLGIAGTLRQIPDFLDNCKRLLNKGGQVILDSSDISYLYDEETAKPEGYFGEIRYQYEYQGEKGGWFDWVYADENTLEKAVSSAGLQLEILHRDETDQYLARIYGF